MSKTSVTVRGKSWERKNSLWVIWSFFGLAGVGFTIIGSKTKEKKWIVCGIAYLISLIGGLFFVSLFDGNIGEILADMYMILYIASIVHCFIAKKRYLIQYDKILYSRERELMDEQIRRTATEKENLEKQNQINLEKEKIISSRTNENQKDNKNLNENENQKENNNTNESKNKKADQAQEKQGGGIIVWIEGAIALAVIVAIGWCALTFVGDLFGVDEIENGYEAEEECKYALTNNVFTVRPSERQVDVEAVSGKDGMVIVRVKINDDELLQYSLYGKDVDEIYYGYEPAADEGHYFSYWGKSEDEVKEKMDW